MLQLAVLVEVLDLEGLGEILSQKMRRAGLQSFAIAHHRLDGISHVRTRKLLGIGLLAGDHRNGGIVYGEVRIGFQHLKRFRFGFFTGRVRGVALLPIEFEGSQEEFRA